MPNAHTYYSFFPLSSLYLFIFTDPELRDAANEEDQEDDEEDEEDATEEKKDESEPDSSDGDSSEHPVLFFNEIAEHVAPVLDDLFPPSSGITLIAEPGRYLVASCATLLVNVTSVRKNTLGANNKVEPYNDREVAEALYSLSRKEEGDIVHAQGDSNNLLFRDMMKEMKHVSQRFARQSLAQQEVDVFTDRLDLSEAMNQSIASFDDQDHPISTLLPHSEEDAKRRNAEHTAEGISAAIIDECIEEEAEEGNGNFEAQRDRAQSSDFQALASAGEAALAGAVLEAVSSVMPGVDDFSYYCNDGVYGAFNCIMFDHAVVRPRLLRKPAIASRRNSNGGKPGHRVQASVSKEGFKRLESSVSDSDEENSKDINLYSSTIFGPSCDSIDVVARSVLLPKLKVGDWLYFQNMGAYTSAAASSFNGFDPSAKFYVCSVRPENFEKMIEGPDVEE